MASKDHAFPNVEEVDDYSGRYEAGPEEGKGDHLSAVCEVVESKKGFRMCNSKVLECLLYNNNSSQAQECPDCIGNVFECPYCDCKILEGECGVEVHHFYCSSTNSSSTCPTEPDCVFAVNEGWFNEEYDPSSDTLSGFGIIDFKRNAGIEKQADRGCDESTPNLINSYGIKIASFSIIGLAAYSLSAVIGQDELTVM